MARSSKKLGEILVDEGFVTAGAVEAALKMQAGAGKRIGEVLIDNGSCTAEQVAKGLARQFRLPYADLSDERIAARVDASLLPADLIQKYKILPIGKSGNQLQLIVHDPKDLELLDMLRFRLGLEIKPALAARSAIQAFIDGKMGGGQNGSASKPKESLISESIDRSIDKSVDKSVDASIDKAAESAPIIKLCERIIQEAVRMRASDIHIEPMADRVRLRYRIDGVCIERDNLPKRMQNAVLTRMKLMAGVNIAEKRIPQDGRIKMEVPPEGGGEPQVIDFRVSSCPAYHGESIVLRILRPDSVRIGLENLGFEPDSLERFNRIIRRPNGIFLVTGPTGSGKTTTLYTALDILNRPDKKIITAEDPIEYAFTGINQCQVRESIGLSFSSVLRAMLRQAPNIILVGEIRDKEVAEVAIQAALTGHLVFSTLHTNDAPSAITRLIDMGVKPFLVASSIQAVMAQRLIRILAPTKQPDEDPDPKYLRLCNISREEVVASYDLQARAGRWSQRVQGRRGIYEMMVMNAELRDLAFKVSPVSAIRRAAIAAGMRSLLEDGKIKILKGMTTPAEIARVAQVEEIGEQMETAAA
ncbi:MAG: Flp pilus assembly complex ATPase component TadA [Deltaproteobacteria bacterium]|nr:Flp pilus assembly complex ATPase component TadA [Deltaproteobacteria bacterium]